VNQQPAGQDAVPNVWPQVGRTRWSGVGTGEPGETRSCERSAAPESCTPSLAPLGARRHGHRARYVPHGHDWSPLACSAPTPPVSALRDRSGEQRTHQYRAVVHALVPSLAVALRPPHGTPRELPLAPNALTSLPIPHDHDPIDRSLPRAGTGRSCFQEGEAGPHRPPEYWESLWPVGSGTPCPLRRARLFSCLPRPTGTAFWSSAGRHLYRRSDGGEHPSRAVVIIVSAPCPRLVPAEPGVSRLGHLVVTTGDGTGVAPGGDARVRVAEPMGGGHSSGATTTERWRARCRSAGKPRGTAVSGEQRAWRRPPTVTPGQGPSNTAVGVGFEPTVTCATTVFKTVPLGRSGNPPLRRPARGGAGTAYRPRSSGGAPGPHGGCPARAFGGRPILTFAGGGRRPPRPPRSWGRSRPPRPRGRVPRGPASRRR
jgi:hypothetical protein